MALPPQVSAESFGKFCARLREIVGADWVFTGADDVYLYSDAYSPFKGEPVDPLASSGGVAPDSVEQVQRIVQAANQYKVPLWPISTGRNLGYGGAGPRLAGTLVLDLKRMNRVLEVNDNLCYALVEPGVSYFDFYRYLQEHDHKVWMDCPDPGWGSLIGNALDHGVGHTPYRDHFGAHVGMEVVLPNGDLLRTGAGAMPGSKQFNTFPYGYGPHVSPLFGQSNFGIVTKMGFTLLPAQEATRSDIITVPKLMDVVPLLHAMARLESEYIIDCSWSVGSPLLGAQDAAVRAAIERSGGAPSAELDSMGADKQLPAWSIRSRLTGAPSVMDAKWEYAQRRIREFVPAAGFRAESYFHLPEDRDKIVEDLHADPMAKAAVGIPSLSIFALGSPPHSQGHIFFSPIIAMDGEELLRAYRVFRKAYKELGIPVEMVSASGWNWFRRNLVILLGQQIWADPEANRRMRENIRKLARIAADNGWGEYRTPPIFMDDIAAAYSFNNHALRRFNEQLKDTLDPNGIISPGRGGIWPARFRSLRGKPQ